MSVIKNLFLALGLSTLGATSVQAAGIGQRGLQALASASYSQSTINADRNQKGVKYTLDRFIKIRLGSLDGFAASARKRKNANAPGDRQHPDRGL